MTQNVDFLLLARYSTQLGVPGGLCNPSYWDGGILGWLENGSPPRRLLGPLERLQSASILAGAALGIKICGFQYVIEDQPALPRGFGVDPKIGAAALRAPASSREDSRPQAILKFHRPSSLDYKARHELLV